MDPGQDLGYVLETIRLVRRELDGRVPLIGFSGAPFTLASYIIEGGPSKDLLKTRAFMRAEPAAWKRLMSLLSAACGRYLEAQAAAGAQALQVFDTWVGVLSKEEYVRGVKPYSSRVLAAAAASGVPVIHFGTGNAAFLEDFADAGGDVVSVDWRLPLDEAWRRVGRRALQGNLDPACLLLPRKELGKTVADVLRRAAGRPGHIFNLGHGISPETPPENVRVVVDLVHGAARQ
jgi:uroporphyrinogen decarboxylase